MALQSEIFYKRFNLAGSSRTILIILLVVMGVFLLRQEIRLTNLSKEIESIKDQQSERVTEEGSDRGEDLASQRVRETDILEAIQATFGPVPGDTTFKKIQLDWKDASRVNELRISDDTGGILLAISAKSSQNVVPHPYVVGTVPDGFTVREGETFEELEAGKTYRAQLKGELDGEPFDTSFTFNVPDLPPHP